MTILVGIMFCILAAVLLVMMFRQHQSGRVELLSVRNIAIVGFIIFQCTSTALSLFTGDYSSFIVNTPAWTGIRFLFYALLFLGIALTVYRSGWLAGRMAHWIPSTWVVPNNTSLVLMAFVTTLLAVVFKLAGSAGLFGPLAIVAGTLSIGMGALSAGLVGWAWGKQLLNPLLVLVGVFIVLINFTIVLEDTFGRRGLVAIAGALLWGMYYSHWRYLTTRGLLKRLSLVCIPPLLFIAAYTSIRGGSGGDRSASGQLTAMTSYSNLERGVQKLFFGQGCGAVSMWLIEAYPEDFPYRNLSMVQHFIIYPVPRTLWEDKPMPLSWEIPYIAQLQDVPRGVLTIGPGVIGTANSDGGVLVVMLYAVLGGVFLRFFDELLRLNPYSPFVVLPIGSALGHVLGLARGSTSAFGFLTVMTVFGTLIFMVMVGKLVQMGKRETYIVEGEEEYEEFDEDEEEYDTEYGGIHTT